MTILVTGGTGLVGPRLLTRLAAAGFECRALVRAGKDVPDGVERIEGDILSPDTLAAALDGVDAIIHLAAVFRTRDEDEIWRVNLEGTRNLLAATVEAAPDARFLMSSTGNVYANGGGRPGREDDDVHPTLAYPASKIEAEKLLRESGLNWSILRLPFIYGDGDGHLESLPVLASDRHPAERLTVAHHVDVATAFELALTGAMDGRIVNIGDDASPTLYELAQLVGVEFRTSTDPLADPWKGVMDTALARSLGFQPKVATIYQAVRDGLL
ncbi:MAG TPA: NAD(P)-dependent oxidoreductase [Galbitalea sp.]|jgi:nucleoside-diphosphate-sugar epimerase|nr:NAD(P)-dependent oxidoreductase [Galbitalea sp.]